MAQEQQTVEGEPDGASGTSGPGVVSGAGENPGDGSGEAAIGGPTGDGSEGELGTSAGLGEVGLAPAFESAAAGEAVPAAGPTIKLELKHSLAIRWMHWINFPVLFTMIWSGLLIYWTDSDIPYQHPHEVYRVGIGPITLFRLFPPWFWKLLNAPYQITMGLGYHFFFMWIFALNGLVYVSYLSFSGKWRLMVPTVRSWREAVQVTLYDLHLSKVHPPVKKYNGAQRIAYTAIVLMGAGSLVTGIAIYKPAQVHWITTLLGGYEMARWEHFWLTMGFCGFFLLHVGQVIKTGWNNFRGMVSGMEIRPVDAIPYAEEGRDT